MGSGGRWPIVGVNHHLNLNIRILVGKKRKQKKKTYQWLEMRPLLEPCRRLIPLSSPSLPSAVGASVVAVWLTGLYIMLVIMVN